MKKIIVIILLFNCNHAISANSISINFIKPTFNQPSDSILVVQVEIQSSFEIASVTGNVNGHVGTLSFDGLQSFYGTILLAGLQKGVPLQLTVTVTDALNNQQTASQNFIYAPPPKINVVYPIPFSNTAISLPIKANAISIDTCTLRVNVAFTPAFFDMNFTDAVDTVISVPAGYAGGIIYFTATDKWGQSTYHTYWVTFENNPYLSPVYNGTGKIYDFNYNKALVVSTTTYGSAQGAGKIVDVTTNASSPVTAGSELNYFDNESQSFLTPYGAIFGQTLNIHPFEWKDNTVQSLWNFDLSTYIPVHTSGNYATWTRTSAPNQTDIHLRNLATGSDAAVITADQPDAKNDVAANGVVVYENGINILKYQDGVTTTIVENLVMDTGLLKPITDGEYVVYLKEANCCDEYWLWLNNGTNNFLLSALGSYPAEYAPAPGSFYQVKNKFVAYLKPGTTGQTQIWLRDSTGANSQITFFGTSSIIECLNDKGDIIFNNDGTRYFAEKGVAQPIPLGPDYSPKVVYRDSSWYVIENATVYRLLVHAYFTTQDGNWNDPATWQNGIVPPANADVVVLNNVTVNINASCNSLNIHTPGHITVLPGITFTILH